MVQSMDKMLLRPGDVVTFADRDDLLAKLDLLDQPVPARHQGRKKEHRERHCIVRYLHFLAAGDPDLLPLPVTLRKAAKQQDPPDFVLEWRDGRRESFEVTDGSTETYQKALTAASATQEDRVVLPVDINTHEREATQLWAEILFATFLEKAEILRRGRFTLDHLLIYDLTGLGLLVPLASGAPLLRQHLQKWQAKEQPAHRFGRVSVLRDLALILDVAGDARMLRSESPYFQIPVIRAHDEDDLSRRLRELDRYCRLNSIRHLKLFGSMLGDTTELREGSDHDLLVEFEPGTRVTLLDMARMERQIGDLIGFKVDLRTAEDLSRYFRGEVLDQAVELHAAQR